MTVKRVQRTFEWTPEQKARMDAVRARLDKSKPSLEELVASGEYEQVQAGAFWEVRRVMAKLKAERERQGLSLAGLAELTGIDKGAISKLETGRQANPTVDTLHRLAGALGVKLGLTLQVEPEENAKPRKHADTAPTNSLSPAGPKKARKRTAAN